MYRSALENLILPLRWRQEPSISRRCLQQQLSLWFWPSLTTARLDDGRRHPQLFIAIAGLGLYTHDHACARVDVHPKHLAAPLAFINEDATMTVEGSYGVETANLNDSPPSPAADAASDPGGFGIGVLAELKLKVGTRVDPVCLGERTPEQQWRQ
jgi:hypothetical protein